MRRKYLQFFGLTFLGILSLLMASFGALGYWTEHNEMKASKPIPVKVLSSQLTPLTQGGHLRYTADIRYTYSVKGKPYYGNQLVAPPWPTLKQDNTITGSNQWASHLLQQYKAGSVLTGFYLSKEPAISFLTKGYHPATFRFMELGGLFIVFFAVGLCLRKFLLAKTA